MQQPPQGAEDLGVPVDAPVLRDENELLRPGAEGPGVLLALRQQRALQAGRENPQPPAWEAAAGLAQLRLGEAPRLKSEGMLDDGCGT